MPAADGGDAGTDLVPAAGGVMPASWYAAARDSGKDGRLTTAVWPSAAAAAAAAALTDADGGVLSPPLLLLLLLPPANADACVGVLGVEPSSGPPPDSCNADRLLSGVVVVLVVPGLSPSKDNRAAGGSFPRGSSSDGVISGKVTGPEEVGSKGSLLVASVARRRSLVLDLRVLG